MKKNELMNGDIVVERSGHLGIVIIGADEYIVFSGQQGADYLENYNDDMTYMYPEGAVDPGDIMQVYRGSGASFLHYEDEEMIYERDSAWTRPTEEEIKAADEAKKKQRERELEDARKRKAESKADLITIVAQAFYGNRTGTQIRRADLDAFLQGYVDATHFSGENIDRTIVSVPETDNLVIVYNKYQEAEAIQKKELLLKKEGYQKKPLAVIPSTGLEIYSRCIVCRINEAGEFESLQPEDYEKFMHYLAE